MLSRLYRRPLLTNSLLVLLCAASAFGTPAGDLRLVQAVKAGDKTAAAALLQQRVDVNAPEADGTTALHWAVRQDDLDMVDRLIRAGADAKAVNRYGVSALYLACVNGSAATIEKLLKAGSDANAIGTEGEAALMTAARTGSVEAARVLLAHGADVNAKESWRGQTALMWAAAERHPAMVRELIAHGADVSARSIIQKWERQNTAEPREKWLPPGGMTALLFAAREGCLECLPILLEAGSDVNVTDPDGISALLSAIINGHYDAAGILLERGADPNLADKTGRTALYSAVDFNAMPNSNRPAPKVIENELTSLDLIKKLLSRGADVNAQLKTQQPYRTKLDRGDDTMLTSGTTPFLRAAKAGDLAAMRLLLEKGADAKLATRNGINPLMAAAGLGTKEEDTTGRRKTQNDVIEAIKLCLEAGIDIDAVDSRGQTALYGAALQGFDDVVQFLADHDAKLDVKDKQGHTPLDAAEGLAGGVGFDGSSSVPHPSTAALIRKLMAAPREEGQRGRGTKGQRGSDQCSIPNFQFSSEGNSTPAAGCGVSQMRIEN
jgi:ankyrin repeat protein